MVWTSNLGYFKNDKFDSINRLIHDPIKGHPLYLKIWFSRCYSNCENIYFCDWLNTCFNYIQSITGLCLLEPWKALPRTNQNNFIVFFLYAEVCYYQVCYNRIKIICLSRCKKFHHPLWFLLKCFSCYQKRTLKVSLKYFNSLKLFLL